MATVGVKGLTQNSVLLTTAHDRLRCVGHLVKTQFLVPRVYTENGRSFLHACMRICTFTAAALCASTRESGVFRMCEWGGD